MKFDSTEFNFDTIQSGDIVEHTFTFQNTGKYPLFIHQVFASCGCTTMEYSNDTIPPGGKGFIKVKFDSNNKFGQVKKHFEVLSNSPHQLIYISGFVKDKPKKKSE